MCPADQYAYPSVSDIDKSRGGDGIGRERDARDSRGRVAPSGVAIYSAVVSTLAFVGTVFSIWYSSLRSPNMEVQRGSIASIAMWRTGEPGIMLPLVFYNSGSSAGDVIDPRLEITDIASRERVNLPAFRYYIFNAGGVNYGQQVGPEIIKGGEVIRRDIIFRMEAPPQRQFLFRASRYSLEVFYHSSRSSDERVLGPFYFTPQKGAADYVNRALSTHEHPFETMSFRFDGDT